MKRLVAKALLLFLTALSCSCFQQASAQELKLQQRVYVFEGSQHLTVNVHVDESGKVSGTLRIENDSQNAFEAVALLSLNNATGEPVIFLATKPISLNGKGAEQIHAGNWGAVGRAFSKNIELTAILPTSDLSSALTELKNATSISLYGGLQKRVNAFYDDLREKCSIQNATQVPVLATSRECLKEEIIKATSSKEFDQRLLEVGRPN